MIHSTVLLFAYLCFRQTLALILPYPKGPFSVQISSMELIDRNRTANPFGNSSDPRAIMMSLFYPVRAANGTACTSKYMPPATASLYNQLFASSGRNGVFESLELQTACKDSSSSSSNALDNFPVIIFSPGFSTSRFLYSAILQNVASFGYVIAAMDHPFDADIVEFPDGRIVKKAFLSLTSDQLEVAVATRTKDTAFLLEQLSQPSVIQQLVPSSHASQRLKAGKVAMFGHSLGGATTASAMFEDSRIAGGINLDGVLHGPVIQQGLDRSFILFGSDGHNSTSDQGWHSFYSQLQGFKREFGRRDLQHGGYTDTPLLAKLVGLGQDPNWQAALGKLDGERSMDILSSYIPSFFDLVFKGTEAEILSQPNLNFPEIVILQQ